MNENGPVLLHGRRRRDRRRYRLRLLACLATSLLLLVATVRLWPASREGDAETSQSAAPEIGARQLRIPEPNYTEAARSGDVRAQVEMEVTIAPSGRVKDARILRRVLLSSEDGSGTKRTVEALGYGLEEAALDAARRTLFRPARAGGKAVQSRKTLTLTFGPGG